MMIEQFEDPLNAQALSFIRGFVVLAMGSVFGYGLGLSAMIYPVEVMTFLHLQNLGLLLVMGVAVAVVLPFFMLAPKGLRAPLLGGGPFERRRTETGMLKTVLGAALFGMGWGLSGVCPGTALAGLGAGNWEVLWVLLGIFGGALLQGLLANWATR
jgi:uncharacterized membrane protein YedE/YeeE